MSLLVVVGSTNPVKIAAAKTSFEQAFPNEQFAFVGESAPSGVSDQPMSQEETITGAMNRLQYIEEKFSDAAYWVSMEGGCEEQGNDISVFAWMVVKGSSGKIAKACTASFFLPQKIASLVREGMELSDADDVVFGRENSKHSSGVVGLLTNEIIDRTEYYVHAMILALIPFLQTEYYD